MSALWIAARINLDHIAKPEQKVCIKIVKDFLLLIKHKKDQGSKRKKCFLISCKIKCFFLYKP